MNTHRRSPTATLALAVLLGAATPMFAKPNVVLIVCDDLNDFVTGMDGHPQARTPNIEKLANSGVSFRRAYCNVPVCAPSRSSFMTGTYAHTSRNMHFKNWRENRVLANCMTLSEYFRANDYHTTGSGKVMHHVHADLWHEYKYKPDYGPFVYDGKQRVGHPSVPEPFRSIGAVDGSFAPLSDLPYGPNPRGNKGWIYGTWGKVEPMRYDSPTDRDPTPDERNAAWAAQRISQFAQQSDGKPFFLAVGFIRPHTPLHVPQRFFDMFPKDTLRPPVIQPGDAEDTHYADVFNPEIKGLKYFRLLKESYPSLDDGIKAFLQAYLASIAAVDECVGQVVDAVDRTGLANNTIIVLTSDHGWNMCEKDYLFKNSLWEESTRVPLVIRAPGVTTKAGIVEHPVSLIDLYPTLKDLCGLEGTTLKNDKRWPKLEGHSMRPFLVDPESRTWTGPDFALSMITAQGAANDPARQHYSVRTERWRYIRYNNGAEELYDHANDPYEWTNLANVPKHAATLAEMKQRLPECVPR